MVGHTKRSPLNFPVSCIPMRRASPPYKMADESTCSKINHIFTSRPPPSTIAVHHAFAANPLLKILQQSDCAIAATRPP